MEPVQCCLKELEGRSSSAGRQISSIEDYCIDLVIACCVVLVSALKIRLPVHEAIHAADKDVNTTL
jgi:hypothetical protein